LKSEVKKPSLFDGTVACPKLFGLGGQREKNGESINPSGKSFSEKPLLFSEKTSLRDRGDRENLRKQPAYVLEKVADARKPRENEHVSTSALFGRGEKSRTGFLTCHLRKEASNLSIDRRRISKCVEMTGWKPVLLKRKRVSPHHSKTVGKKSAQNTAFSSRKAGVGGMASPRTRENPRDSTWVLLEKVINNPESPSHAVHGIASFHQSIPFGTKSPDARVKSETNTSASIESG
jgi:hypothetical protein